GFFDGDAAERMSRAALWPSLGSRPKERDPSPAQTETAGGREGRRAPSSRPTPSVPGAVRPRRDGRSRQGKERRRRFGVRPLVVGFPGRGGEQPMTGTQYEELCRRYVAARFGIPLD